VTTPPSHAAFHASIVARIREAHQTWVDSPEGNGYDDRPPVNQGDMAVLLGWIDMLERLGHEMADETLGAPAHDPDTAARPWRDAVPRRGV